MKTQNWWWWLLMRAHSESNRENTGEHVLQFDLESSCSMKSLNEHDRWFSNGFVSYQHDVHGAMWLNWNTLFYYYNELNDNNLHFITVFDNSLYHVYSMRPIIAYYNEKWIFRSLNSHNNIHVTIAIDRCE